MARKSRRSSHTAGELNLTAMIDVAFQLLSFFIITSHPVDVLTNLDVSAPSPQKTQEKDTKPPPVLRITVAASTYLLNDVPVGYEDMDSFIQKMAAGDPGQTVLIQCDQGALHYKLVAALDLCAKAGLKNISIVSANKVEGTPR
jgi:biopolymer transport protein ExbD